MHQMCIFSGARTWSRKLSIGTVNAGDRAECACAYFDLFWMLRNGYKKIQANILESRRCSWTDVISSTSSNFFEHFQIC